MNAKLVKELFDAMSLVSVLYPLFQRNSKGETVTDADVEAASNSAHTALAADDAYIAKRLAEG